MALPSNPVRRWYEESRSWTMHLPTYISYRTDCNTYKFRWTVPVELRPLMGGRREIRKSLNTDDKRLALRLARRLAVMLERVNLMTKRSKNQPEGAALTVKLLEKLVDGTVRIEGLEMDPDPAKAEEDR